MTDKFIVLLLIIIFMCAKVDAQKSSYKEYNVCNYLATYKGKKNHGQKHCTGWVTVREYKDGRKDTVSWVDIGFQTFLENEYEKYQKLSERGKYIVDSLKEDGVSQLQDSYLTYEPMYMKVGKKAEWFWRILGQDIIMYKYLFWKSDRGSGIQLLKEIAVK